MRFTGLRRRWRWLLTLVLVLLVGVIWIVIVNTPSEPTGKLLIERQENGGVLFHEYDFSTKRLTIIPYKGSNPIDVAFQISVSPNGNRVAFLGSSGNQYWIYTADRLFKEVRPISIGTRDFHPRVSPDNTAIVFERLNGYFSALFAVDVVTGIERQLTEYTNDLEADWSPDGKRIVFTTSRDGFQELYTMAADGTDQQRLTNNAKLNDLNAKNSPDGKWIAYMTNHSVGDGTGEIWLMDADGQNQRQLTDNQLDDRWPVWSPDSHQIAFTQTQPNDIGSHIFVYDLEREHIQQLTTSSAYEFQPVWSPDSQWIGFISNPSGDGQQLNVEIMRANGTDRHPLLSGSDNISAGRGFVWTR